jgi:CRP/FNR family transcriptional regulator
VRTIGELKYFSGLDLREMDDISKCFEAEHIKKGTIFLMEGGSSRHLYLLYSGAVKIFKTTPSGKELILSIPSMYRSLNAVTMYSRSPNMASMQALSEVIVYKVGMDDIISLIKKYPQLAINALTDLARVGYRAWMLCSDIAFNQVIYKLGKILLKINETEQTWPRLTQSEIASMIGTSRKAVNRALKELEDRKIVRIDRYGIIITDKTKLEMLINH